VQTTPTRQLSITLPEALVQALDRQAHRYHMTRSAVMAQYLARALEDEAGL
jgi:metal-responsive CopG/Arc/MetJ family transcriptional regulator